jgi:hypothetical protein
MNLVETAAEAVSDVDLKKKGKKEGAQLTLETFVLYKSNEDGTSFDLFPPPAALRPGTQRPIVTVGNIPFPTGVPHPENAITALYGFRDALEEIQRQLKFAREKNMRNIKVTFKVQVREIVMGTTDLQKIASTDFLNLRRLQSDLANIIVDGINERMAQEAPAGQSIEPYHKITDACPRPDLLCDVIRSEKIFSHIKAVAYMIPDEEGSKRGRQVCTVFDDRFEEVSFRGDMPFDIELPCFAAA